MEQQLLDQLVDVYQPEAISWWPLAPGWWFLIVACSIFVIVISVWLVKRYRNRYWKKEALSQFNDIYSRFTQEPGEKELIALMQLIKSIIFTTTKDSKSLSLVGDELSAMTSTLNNKIAITEEINLLQASIYQANCLDFTSDNFSKIRTWIKGL